MFSFSAHRFLPPEASHQSLAFWRERRVPGHSCRTHSHVGRHKPAPYASEPVRHVALESLGQISTRDPATAVHKALALAQLPATQLVEHYGWEIAAWVDYHLPGDDARRYQLLRALAPSDQDRPLVFGTFSLFRVLPNLEYREGLHQTLFEFARAMRSLCIDDSGALQLIKERGQIRAKNWGQRRLEFSLRPLVVPNFSGACDYA